MSTLWKPSVTVAAVVQHEGRFLLVEEQTPDGVRLNQPAGHLEPGETPLQGVVREALEETARAFTPAALLGIYLARTQPRGVSEAVTYLRLAFVGSVGEPETGRLLDDGILRTLWLSADEIRARSAEHRSPLVMKCIDDHLSGQRFPLSLVYAHPSVTA